MKNEKINIFELSKNTYWKYDNAYKYENRLWDSYSGPYFSKANYLLMLYYENEIIILHIHNHKSEIILKDNIFSEIEFDNILKTIEIFRINYCKEHNIDSEKDIEYELVSLKINNVTVYKKLTLFNTIAIFIGFTAYFFILLFTLLPFLKATFSINPALYWFITGYFLFIPLFLYSIVATKFEGNTKITNVLQALHIKKLSRIDVIYSIIGLLFAFILTGIIFAASTILNKYFGIRLLSTTPWFMEMHPFHGIEKLLLLVWLPMFFFNIAGEEMLWRGYIQTRLEGKFTWLLCSLLWMIFHLPFGIDLMIILIPVILIIPYVYSKTRNTVTGIFIHGLFNGPVFVMVALGLIQ